MTLLEASEELKQEYLEWLDDYIHIPNTLCGNASPKASDVLNAAVIGAWFEAWLDLEHGE